MERLTEKSSSGKYRPIPMSVSLSDIRPWVACAERLAQIENILGDEYDLDRLKQLADADKNGRCVVLPCAIKAGQHIFVIEPKERTGTLSDSVWCNTVISFTHSGIFYRNSLGCPVYFEPFDKFGETWFLDRESAEAKLKEVNL